MKSEKNIFRNCEIYVALMMLLFAAFIFAEVCRIRIPESRMLPILTGSISLVCGIVHMVLSIRKNEGKDVSVLALKLSQIILMVTLIASYFVYELLGFYTTLFFVLLISSFTIMAPKTKKDVLKVLIYDAVLMVFTWVCFAMFLGLATPTGLFI